MARRLQEMRGREKERRSIALGPGLLEDYWPRIRLDLVHVLESRQHEYRCMFGTTNYNNIYSTVNVVGRWMVIPHTGLVIASKYNKVVLSLSNDGGCATSFPLWSSPPQSNSHEIIVIAHVNGNHYIRVDLREGFPLPRTHPMWNAYKSDIASGWRDTYVNRQNDFHDYYYRDPNAVDKNIEGFFLHNAASFLLSMFLPQVSFLRWGIIPTLAGNYSGWNHPWNTCGKFGLVKSMLNSSTGLFSFQFSTTDGLNSMLENGPWFIRDHPLILRKWNPDVDLLKEDVRNVPVWVKLHGVPVTAFSEDGLSVIDTKLGTSLMLDSYTSHMCLQSWGMSSYAKVIIELWVLQSWGRLSKPIDPAVQLVENFAAV
nr:hypothetical protein [Tanacetum cinerariifolium]